MSTDTLDEAQVAALEPSEQAEAEAELAAAAAALSAPNAGAEVLAYIRQATAQAAREHDLVLARSQELAGIHLFP